MLNKKLDEYVRNGSRRIVEAIENIGLVIKSYKLLNPRKGQGDTTLLKGLKEGEPEGECFRYSALAAIYRHRLVQRKQDLTKKYKRFQDNLNFTIISPLTNIKEDINTFECQNLKYVVTIFQWDDDDEKKKLPVTVIRSPCGKKASSKTTIMLLLVKGDDAHCHYISITNLDWLLNSKDGPRD